MDNFNATGRRKTSVARVYVTPGKGDITVNARDLKEYFLSEIHQTMVKQPLVALKFENQYDVSVNVEGGGVKGQAEAILRIQQANADGIRFLKDSQPDAAVLQIKSLEAFAQAADGKATKIIIPSQIQGIAGLASSLKEVMTDVPKAE